MKKFLLTFFILTSFCSFGQSVPKTAISFRETERIVKFYPNPAISVINFELSKLSEGGYSLQIFSFVGKKVLEVNDVNAKTSVPLTDFFRGVYIFQLRDRTGKLVESGKFQVAK
jgi:hypothetical protein